MNLTFSMSANFILFVLFIFSVTSFSLLVHCLLKIRQVKNEILSFNSDNTLSEDKFSVLLLPLERLLDWLPSMASISMLLGLFGTVIGIYSSFAEMQLTGKATIDVLAGGIKDALVTTIAGLAAAIPSLVFSQILEHELSKLEEFFYKLK